MKKVTKILFPTDFSSCAENAFAYTLELAASIDAQVEVLHVVYPIADSLDYPVLVSQATQVNVDRNVEQLRQFIKNGLAKVKREIDSNLYTSQDIEIGVPIDMIIQKAQRDSIDLIVMGTKDERKGLDRWFGSVASGVVAKANCPVMVVPEDADFGQPKTMVYASDLLKADPYEIWKATQWLNAFDLQVHCVHVNDGQQDESIQLEDLKAFFASQHSDLNIQFHHLPGKQVTSTMNDFAEKINADILAMYQPKRPFIERIFHKSYTTQMAGRPRIPLLVMK